MYPSKKRGDSNCFYLVQVITGLAETERNSRMHQCEGADVQSYVRLMLCYNPKAEKSMYGTTLILLRVGFFLTHCFGPQINVLDT